MNVRQRFGLGILIAIISMVTIKNPSGDFGDSIIYLGMLILGFFCFVL